MKKAYTKPQLFVEDFALTQTVAVNCGTWGNTPLGKPNHKDKTTCGWYFDEYTTLWISEPTCNIPWGENDDFQGICYNNPDGGVSIFAS